ncbi:hypothetical protein FXV83_38700 [Bradyrhizobium hipponense]|uniref:Uncharacterized protein n=1 Tax=Bradyrhizobium hipponense TaxID=2605638 RepID=A0A5S4YBL2_9BRAD|nr:hypothetical protein FXV83_38700 [Bradyrhizobium hipponense]
MARPSVDIGILPAIAGEFCRTRHRKGTSTGSGAWQHPAELRCCRGASQTGSASFNVLASVKSLSGESSRLKLEVGILDAIRAA